jgi:hypothetical protein
VELVFAWSECHFGQQKERKINVFPGWQSITATVTTTPKQAASGLILLDQGEAILHCNEKVCPDH